MAEKAFSFGIRAQGLAKLISNYDELPEVLHDAILKYLQESTPLLQAEVVHQASGTVLKVRSGRVRSSIRSRVDEKRLEGIVGSKHPAIRQIEFGGIITAKGKAGLAIPLKGALTKAGVAKKPRSYTNTFFVRRTRDGTLFMFGKRTPKASEIVPLFVFKKSVTQKPKKLFELSAKVASEEIENSAIRHIEDAIIKLFESEL